MDFRQSPYISGARNGDFLVMSSGIAPTVRQPAARQQGGSGATDFELPPTLRAVELPAGDGRTYKLLVTRESPGPYDQWILSVPQLTENAKLIQSILNGSGTLIDLGANIGTIAVPIAITGSRVLAVEMLPQNCLKLSFAVLENGLSNVRIVQAAVGDVDGILNFGGTEAWGAVLNNGGQSATALTLDTIVATLKLAEPTFLDGEIVLKLDIEGYELPALRGSKRLLERRPIALFESVETEGDRGATFECKCLFERMDYRLFMVKSTILVPKTSLDVQEEYVADFLAVPGERVEELAGQLQGQYEIRATFADEAIAWMTASAFHSPNHRTHVSRVIARLAEEDPDFAGKSEALRASLEAPNPVYLFAEFPRTADMPTPKRSWWKRLLSFS